MIIWINGAFGAGKTTIADLLAQKLNKSYIYDPEELGDFFRQNLPVEIQKEDFQDYPEWRSWNIRMLEKLDAEYSGDIIVPMTLYKEAIFDELFFVLKERNIAFKHFLLEVSRKELISRLSQRNQVLKEWGNMHLDEELTFFEKIPTSEKINNEQNPERVVKEIISFL